ncbi:hypothetical protein [Streptomyces mirabilis]|uniref:hypothetical protein n=1 Tax=Streptomyces mirabilis TaxID=68239 RepID=UPI00381A0EC2
MAHGPQEDLSVLAGEVRAEDEAGDEAEDEAVRPEGRRRGGVVPGFPQRGRPCVVVEWLWAG